MVRSPPMGTRIRAAVMVHSPPMGTRIRAAVMVRSPLTGTRIRVVFMMRSPHTEAGRQGAVMEDSRLSEGSLHMILTVLMPCLKSRTQG